MPRWATLWGWVSRRGVDGNAPAASTSPRDDELERPWLTSGLRTWFPPVALTSLLNAEVRAKAADVARRTMGDAAWEQLHNQGYLDVRSCCIPGLTYRLRVGRRLQLLWDSPEFREASPWRFGYLCVNPTYPLPAVEFTAHLFLYLSESETQVVQVAVPQSEDGSVANVFR